MRMIYVFLLLMGVSQAAQTQVPQGFWAQECQLENDEDWLQAGLQFENGRLEHTFTAFEEENCRTPYLNYQIQYVYDWRAPSLNLQVEKVAYQLLSDEVARALNQVGYCGFKNWKKDQWKDVTGLKCDEFQLPEKGQKVYSLLKLENGDLFLGQSQGSFDGTSEAKRHRDFLTKPFVRSENFGGSAFFASQRR